MVRVCKDSIHGCLGTLSSSLQSESMTIADAFFW